MSTLKNKSIVIIGGTSGMGLATAKEAKAEGANVTVIGYNPEQTELVAQEFGFDWRVADVTKEETVRKALADIPHVDHLALLAGTFVAGNILDSDINYLHKAFDERIWGAVHAIRSLGDRLDKNASITFISGILADRPSAGTAILSAASAGMEAFARGLVFELAPRRVNTISPGTTDTPLLAKTLGENREAFINSMKEKSPLKRVATAEQVASTIIFLMKNEIMNGETIHVDGGQRLV